MNDRVTQPELLSVSEFNRFMGYKGRYAYQLRNEGRLVMTEDGKHVKVAESIQRITETRDPSRANAVARHAVARGTSMPPLPPQGGDEELAQGGEVVAPGGFNFQDSKAKREHFAALREESSYLKEIGQLMDAEEALGAFADGGARVAAVLDGVAATVGPMLVGLPIGDVIRVLEEQMDIARSELARAVDELAESIEKRRAQEDKA